MELPDRLLTVQDLAEYLGVPATTLYQWPYRRERKRGPINTSSVRRCTLPGRPRRTRRTTSGTTRLPLRNLPLRYSCAGPCAVYERIGFVGAEEIEESRVPKDPVPLLACDLLDHPSVRCLPK